MIKSRRLDSHWDNKGHVLMNLIKGMCFTGTAPMMPGDWVEFLGIHRQAVQAGVFGASTVRAAPRRSKGPWDVRYKLCLLSYLPSWVRKLKGNQ